jgi:hypothetical protein
MNHNISATLYNVELAIVSFYSATCAIITFRETIVCGCIHEALT